MAPSRKRAWFRLGVTIVIGGSARSAEGEVSSSHGKPSPRARGSSASLGHETGLPVPPSMINWPGSFRRRASTETYLQGSYRTRDLGSSVEATAVSGGRDAAPTDEALAARTRSGGGSGRPRGAETVGKKGTCTERASGGIILDPGGARREPVLFHYLRDQLLRERPRRPCPDAAMPHEAHPGIKSCARNEIRPNRPLRSPSDRGICGTPARPAESPRGGAPLAVHCRIGGFKQECFTEMDTRI